LSEIRGYTLRQLRAFTEAGARARRRHLADLLSVMRAAEYDKKDFKAFMGKLTDG
jgi:hypothetical protein